MLGKDETVRFLNLALFQGMPIKKGITTIVCSPSPTALQTDVNYFTSPFFSSVQAMATSDNPLLAQKDEPDPTLFCTAWKRPRFYLFTRSHPEFVFPSSTLCLFVFMGCYQIEKSPEIATFSTKSPLETSLPLRRQ